MMRRIILPLIIILMLLMGCAIKPISDTKQAEQNNVACPQITGWKFTDLTGQEFTDFDPSRINYLNVYPYRTNLLDVSGVVVPCFIGNNVGENKNWFYCQGVNFQYLNSAGVITKKGTAHLAFDKTAKLVQTTCDFK